MCVDARATLSLLGPNVLRQEPPGPKPPPAAGSPWWGGFDFPNIKGCGDRKCSNLSPP